jgi:hypothetical protein
VVLPAAGFIIWAMHFGAIYAVHALACERAMADWQLFGLPWVSVLVSGATLLALAALGLTFLLLRQGGGVIEGGETEPLFTQWFGGAACVVACFAILLEALPALVLPACR